MEERKDKGKYPVVPADYKLLEEIGQGVSGLVFRAFCVPLGEYVAVKQLDLEKCSGTLDTIRKEAQTMSLISHSNVVKAHCSFVVSQHLWVVMPYMGGGSCLHIMKATSPDGFDEPVIATILRDTLKALEYLHRQGHIHRDVKAGNILIHENGAVKLGDFGVAAFMFDNGDRQWSRKTFVGTPCWMAPEVMEQINGYDFKADVWSFGITALELAHGHAPFSKYPPLKVLLMTLQNAAPGLTYERDKRFSKSFKEMIAMCLVKDPTKRPTAEKLLKHSFFKSAKSSDYIVRHVLDGLPPLWERVRDVKLKDAARLAEKKTSTFEEQEEKSQNAYKRGVSGWNFDVEDLKAQAAMLQDDDYAPVIKKEEEGVPSKTVSRVASPHTTISADDNLISETIKAEIPLDGEECIVRKPPNGAKIRGRFNVFVDNVEIDSSNWCENAEQLNGEERALAHHKEEKFEDKELDDSKIINAKDISMDHNRQLDFDDALTDKPLDDERTRDHKLTMRPSGEENPSTVPSSNGVVDHRPANGSAKPPPGKEDEKVKGPVVQKKGRFSVTSADVNLKDLKENKDVERLAALPNVKVKSSVNSIEHSELLSPSSLRRTSSAQMYQQVFPQSSGTSPSPATPSTTGYTPVSTAALLPLLQNLLNQTAMQQDMIVNLMTIVCNHGTDLSAGASNQRLSRSASASAVDHGSDNNCSDRERDLRQQVLELQVRVGVLGDELQMMKLRNVQLERQLNAIFNKEEEERIRKEEAAKEDG
ncbi:serine/threonine-protein kinase BLUS1 isoform X1 [Selaginella moellendorffii]|uniref:serine/threonine-protein kinase BLUS1 isoform X1 n=1 Tax=Selaginella moellendorffii TaxID=88036 RepID=UPI000D1C9CBC|nr:serine/threonine-protein kinase BLUS1 isoform X1 [Selaginella moellendorffii]XP_024522780.1 serine/threonine-protein kinase BLUS1 isoform X1 [Selaginella moellendorffii]|eukprot:XP_002993318.2 serine/threonine-protein kinase BLUS1 isoform X1 [Selaginella moellendorffii]